MSVRIMALGVPRFMSGGLEVSRQWLAVDNSLTEKARCALRDYHGRFIRVHCDDIKKLNELGLQFRGNCEPLVDAHGSAKTDPPKKPTKNDAPKGDGKKE